MANRQVLETYRCVKECFWNNGLTNEGDKVLVCVGQLDKDDRFVKTGIYRQVDKEGSLETEVLTKAQVDAMLKQNTKK